MGRGKIDIFDKKGHSSVLLIMIFSAMLMLVAAFVYSGHNFTNYAYEEAIVQNAGRSILSEFHFALKENYGIFAYKDFYDETEDKMKFYISENMKGKKKNRSFSLTKRKIDALKVKKDEFELINPEIFKEDAIESLKYPSLTKKEKIGKDKESSGVLENMYLIKSLPSHTRGKEAVKSIFKDLTSLVPQGSLSPENFCFDRYIETNFNSYDKNNSRQATFFQNEIEYIIYGKYSDFGNINAFKWDFRIMRFALNSAHVYANAKKMEEILALAEVLTPGPAAAATAIIIAEAWAISETVNDVKLIMDKKNVSFFKNEMQWAVSLSAIKDRVFDIVSQKDDKNSRYFEPMDKSGLNYTHYLRMILAAQKEEKKIYRVMDLIQLNLQGSVDEDFFIKDCYTGLAYSVEINGKNHQNVQKY